MGGIQSLADLMWLEYHLWIAEQISDKVFAIWLSQRNKQFW